jgi:hypothetical protein
MVFKGKHGIPDVQSEEVVVPPNNNDYIIKQVYKACFKYKIIIYKLKEIEK